jgi:hypothetical protein
LAPDLKDTSMNDGLSQELRMEVFAALVAAQDQGASVHDSRSLMAHQFKLSLTEVERIERQGLDHEWPPLA